MDPETLTDSRDRSRRAGSLAQVACAAGLIAAAAHAAVVREHLAHWWGYGTFFAVVAVAQALAAVALYRRPNRRLMLAVAIGNLGLILLYALSRAGGTSFIGPHAGHAEPIGFLDLIAKAAEGIQLAVVFSMLCRSEQMARRADGRPRRLAVVALLALAAIAVAVPGAPAHVKSSANTIEILAAAAPTPNITQPHEVHTEAPPATPFVEEPQAEASPASCMPKATGDPDPVEPGAVLFAHDADLWLAASPDGSVRRLVTDDGDCVQWSPTFRDADTISFATESAIYGLDLRSGQLKQLVEDAGVADLKWSPDGSTLAYLNWAMELRFYSPATGDAKTVRAFGEPMGRCGDMSDETSIAWSPDGRSLLVVSTALDNAEDTMFVINREGRNLVAPRFGTHARWAHDSKTVLYRGFAEPMRWYSLDLETARSAAVEMRAGTHHAAVSPDGRYIAYSDDADRPTLYLYDVVKDTERALIHGYAAPLWLSSNEIAVTKTRACDEDCMMEHGWIEDGETAAFNLAGDRTRTLSLKTTTNASVLLPPRSAPSPTPSPSPAPPSPSPSPSPSESANPLPLPTDPPPASREPSPLPTASP